MARSLRDPEVKTLLDAAQPGWRWKPTLLEVTDVQPRVFTGIAMRLNLLHWSWSKTCLANPWSYH
jgi:hypothetical protein